MIDLVENCDLKNYVAIIPSVSVGNVGQLASDLLISSLSLKKLGNVWHPEILTFAGCDPFGNSTELSTGSFTKSNNSFLENLCKWLKDNEIKQVIILSGVSAHERRDEQLIGEPLRFVFCPLTKKEEFKNAEMRNWLKLENKDLKNHNYSLPTFLPGAGITLKLFQKCVEKEILCCILLEFCSDGNNAPDAIKLANYLDEWLQLKEKSGIDTWMIPPSWNFLFGPLPPTEIFN